MYNNKTVEFDLKMVCERFKRNKQRKMETVKKFTRKVSFKKNAIGDIEKE